MPVEVIPPLVPVTPSNLDSVGRNPLSQTLYVLFLGGGLYAYDGVPPREHAGLMVANSKGRYLNSEIKGSRDHGLVDDLIVAEAA